jgi:thiol:disulfide interchange protein DsbD
MHCSRCGTGAGRRLAAAAAPGLNFRRVSSVDELDQILRTDRPVMLDFYADWCVACKEMERFTFSDAGVQARLAKALLLKADVTANSAQDKACCSASSSSARPGRSSSMPRARRTVCGPSASSRPRNL